MGKYNFRKKRSTKKVYSVIIEGKTEMWYLQMMKQSENLPRIDIKPELPNKKKLTKLYNLVIENSEIYDKVFWVVDLDQIIHQNSVQEFIGYVKKLRKNKKVAIIVNNPCLEFWFLLHFRETGKYYSKCRDVERLLSSNDILKGYSKTEKYFKNGIDIYKKLKPYQKKAIENAKKLGSFDVNNVETAKSEMYNLLEL